MVTHTSDRRSRPRDAVYGEHPRAVLESLIVNTYREMPELCLTDVQAARFFGMRGATCELVLGDLVRERRLRRRPDGQYALP